MEEQSIEVNGKKYTLKREMSFDEMIAMQERKVAFKKEKDPDVVDELSLKNLKAMRELVLSCVDISEKDFAKLSPGDVLDAMTALSDRSSVTDPNSSAPSTQQSSSAS